MRIDVPVTSAVVVNVGVFSDLCLERHAHHRRHFSRRLGDQGVRRDAEKGCDGEEWSQRSDCHVCWEFINVDHGHAELVLDSRRQIRWTAEERFPRPF